jgi:hypothetical protein
MLDPNSFLLAVANCRDYVWHEFASALVYATNSRQWMLDPNSFLLAVAIC